MKSHEPSGKPPRGGKPPRTEPDRVRTDLPDDEAIKRLFPKRVVDKVNEEIGHKPDKKGHEDDDS